jgi:hypothetical protein
MSKGVKIYFAMLCLKKKGVKAILQYFAFLEKADKTLKILHQFVNHLALMQGFFA